MKDTSLEKFEYLLTKEPTNSQLEDMFVWLVYQSLNEHFPNNRNFTRIEIMLKKSALDWWKSPVYANSGFKVPLDKELDKNLYWNYQTLNIKDFYSINCYNKIAPVSTTAWTLMCLSDMSNALEYLYKGDQRIRLIALNRELATITSSSALWGYSFEEKHQYMIELAKPKENYGFTSEDRERWRQERCKKEAEYEESQRFVTVESRKKAGLHY